MKNDIIVVISTYNGSKRIERQLDSIFKQEDVSVSVFIRDDHSTDNTVELVRQYQKRTGYKIDIIEGENKGYARSFWDALCAAPKASFYAFSDQDDVWYKDKLIKSILAFEDATSLPQLTYCKMVRTDSALTPLKEQVKVLTPDVLNKKLVLTQTFNYGASTVINHAAKELICLHFPTNKLVPHDAWAGLLCYWFGKVNYVDESLYSWIRYENSVTGAGTKLSGIKYRLKETFNGKSYMNVAEDLLEHYSAYISEEDKVFLKKLISYKKKISDKLFLLSDSEFKRSTFMGTLSLKFGILTNMF